jgi:hypothetical protein
VQDRREATVATGRRGVLYVVWGTRGDAVLQRSIRSLEQVHPGLPYHVARVAPADAARGLMEKTRMGQLTPFESTLYLDADTIVAGRLDDAFARAEEVGLACCICEAPWTRRYGTGEGDGIEYNTGVLFFTTKAADVFTMWETLGLNTPSQSTISVRGRLLGSLYDDQASFARAVRHCGLNPAVLPLNYNYRPGYQKSFFTPLKIWHDYREPPPGLLEYSLACERGEQPVTYVELS